MIWTAKYYFNNWLWITRTSQWSAMFGYNGTHCYLTRMSQDCLHTMSRAAISGWDEPYTDRDTPYCWKLTHPHLTRQDRAETTRKISELLNVSTVKYSLPIFKYFDFTVHNWYEFCNTSSSECNAVRCRPAASHGTRLAHTAVLYTHLKTTTLNYIWSWVLS